MSIISLSLLAWPPWTPIVTNVGGCYELTGAEARGALCNLPIELHATVFTSKSSFCLIFSGSSSHYPSSRSPYYTLSLPLNPPYQYTPHTPTFACTALIPKIFRVGCSHHVCKSRTTGLCYSARHKSTIGQVAIYCATIFWRRAIYTNRN